MTTVVAVSAGLSEASSTRRLADQLVDAVGRRLGDSSPGRAVIETVSLRELAHDVVDATLTGFASPRLQDVLDKVMAADGLIVATPIYKASYPGLFKSFFDVMETDAVLGKPVLLAATAGTARHSLAIDHTMRPLFAYMQALVVPTGVFASTYDWGAEGAQALEQRIDRAAGELVSLVEGSGTGRSRDDEFDLFSETFRSISQPPA